MIDSRLCNPEEEISAARRINGAGSRGEHRLHQHETVRCSDVVCVGAFLLKLRLHPNCETGIGMVLFLEINFALWVMMAL